ncbi:MAG TPA: sigma-E factor negative regulatory protein [Usitatibacter sp.]|nr:sigma-E factor negative regulatory protein [Usitatibacter sp.]
MTKEISALMDGELDPQEAERAIRACGMDEDRKRTWFLYHMIGEAMRGQAPGSLEVPAGVAEKLRGEPSVLAPHRRAARPAARVAIAVAASVATIGIVGWLGSQGGSPVPVAAPGPAVASSAAPAAVVASSSAPAPVVAASSAPVPVVAAPVAAVSGSIEPVSNTAAIQTVPALTVQEYLVAHRQVPSPELYRAVTNRTPVDAR